MTETNSQPPISEACNPSSEIVSGYDEAANLLSSQRAKNAEEAKLLTQEQKLDIERKKAERKLKHRR